jgi:hypothetical protein
LNDYFISKQHVCQDIAQSFLSNDDYSTGFDIIGKIDYPIALPLCPVTSVPSVVLPSNFPIETNAIALHPGAIVSEKGE